MTSQTRGKSSRQRSAPAAGATGAGRPSASGSASAKSGTASRATATSTARATAGTSARGTTKRSSAGTAKRTTGTAKRTTGTAKGATAPRAGGSGAKGRSGAGGTGRGGPNGPTRGTYLRRRLVVLLIAAAVIAAIAFGVTRFLLPALSAEDAPTTAETSAEGAEPTPADGATDAAGTPDEDALSNPVSCVPAAVGLTLTPAAASTAAGSGLGVAVEIVNAGRVACLLDVGAGALTLEVYSGEDRVWSTQDCPAAAAEVSVLLDTGAAQSASFTWPGTRSVAGCPGGQPVAGAGTYRLVLGLTTDGGPVTTEQAFTVS
ncbi:hypothetical protein [Occultella kanbiaonis]|uniref:hypothetical protein n=1 Tax=Occultella kanbiaonis TaxID=2675754 RepID=UPI0013D71C67|nr:hypothetical protein [Occultella kanbiaonis]